MVSIMKILFNDFRNSDNDTKNLISAIHACVEMNADELSFECDTYHFYDDSASPFSLYVSNHNSLNDKKSAFLLRNVNDLTINGNGSTFVFHGIMNAVTLIGCSSVTLKNFKVIFPEYPYPNGFAYNVTNDYFDLRFDTNEVSISDGRLLVKSGEFYDPVHCDVRFDKQSKEIIRNTGDNSLGVNINTLKAEKLPNGCFRFYGSDVMPSENDVFGLLTGLRRASGILIDSSSNTVISNVTINSCIGIGIMAQCCHNVTIESCSVTPGDNRYVSSAADATHFVCCTGKVTVKDSLFENMLDDALNVHGIYTKITAAGKGTATVNFMNSCSIGIDIYKKGDKLAVVDPDTLLARSFVTVSDATFIDPTSIRISFDCDDILPIDYLVDNITRYPELMFDNNIVRNNRARGMLIATNRRAQVQNSYFHTSGSAIVLECDGKFWFESGGVNNLTVKGNVFDDCRYANWDSGVISIPEGKMIENDRYYHGTVIISDNKFIGKNDVCLYADNVETIFFINNEVEHKYLRLCHVKNFEIQSDVEF